MPKSEFNREELLLKYDLINMSKAEIDKVSKGNPKLTIELHKLKNELTAQKAKEKLSKEERTKKRIEDRKRAKEQAHNTVEKAKEQGRTISVKVKVKPAKPAEQPKPVKPVEPRVKKSSGSTQKSYAEKKKQTEKLQQHRAQLDVLVKEANSRIARLSKMKKVQSRALDEARRTVPESRKSSEIFTSNLRTEKQINRELSRVMAFLGDYTSLARGAENFTNDLTSAGLFGGQYRANGGPGYSDEVDPVIGEKVFDIYHRVLEVEGGWSRVMAYFKANSGGLVEYGSENLINAIYDMVSNFGTSDKATEKIINRASSMIEDMISVYQEMATKQRSGVDYGFLGNDEHAEDRRRRYEWEMQRKGIKI